MPLYIFGVAIVPAIMGLVEVCKRVGLPSRLAPIAAIVFGVLFAVASVYQALFPWLPGVVQAIAFALSAMGLYDLRATAPDYLQGVMALVTGILTKQPPVEPPTPAAPTLSGQTGQ